jgi:hypothetical protein
MEAVPAPYVESLADKLRNLIELLPEIEKDYKNGHRSIKDYAIAVNQLQWLVIQHFQAQGKIDSRINPQDYLTVLLEEGSLYSKLGKDHPVTQEISELAEERDKVEADREFLNKQKKSLAQSLLLFRDKLPEQLIVQAEQTIRNPAATIEDIINLQRLITTEVYR